MYRNNLFESLKQLVDQENKRKPSYIYLDETDNKIKQVPLKLNSSASALINNTNLAKLIHDIIIKE